MERQSPNTKKLIKILFLRISRILVHYKVTIFVLQICFHIGIEQVRLDYLFEVCTPILGK